MMHLYLVRGVIVSDNITYDRVVVIIGRRNSYVNSTRALFAQREQAVGQACRDALYAFKG